MPLLENLAEGFANATGADRAAQSIENVKTRRQNLSDMELEDAVQAHMDVMKGIQAKLGANPGDPQLTQALSAERDQLFQLLHPANNPDALGRVKKLFRHVFRQQEPTPNQAVNPLPSVAAMTAAAPAALMQQDEYAGLSPAEKIKAIRIKHGLEPRASDKEPTSKEPVPLYEGGVLVGIKDPANNKTYTNPNDPNMPPEFKRMWTDISQRLDSARATKDQDEQAKEDRRLKVQEKLIDLREKIHDREQELAQSSKIPAAEANRAAQAEIIKEQVADLRTKLSDPQLQQFIGPVVGMVGGVTRKFSKKAQDFYASQESLDALLPLLHGYRGGAQTHQTFHDAMGSLTIDPGAYAGTLDALDKLADNVTREVQAEYPNAPMFKNKGQSKPPGQQIKDLKGKRDNDPLGIR